MIVTCPGCGRRYRIDESRLGAAGRRVRCSGCQQVFVAGPAPDRPAGAIAGPGRGGGPSSGPATGPSGSSPLVLLADEDREFRDLVKQVLEALGCRVATTADGEEAFRFAVARHPDLMILNVYLRRLLGVAVCEGVKGSPDLRTTKVALVGSVFKSDRFVRGPGHLYGADDYFEDVIPLDELRERLLGLLGRRAPARPWREARRGGAGGTGRPDDADEGLGAASEPDLAEGVTPRFARAPLDPRAEIRRLARIMLSDLKIYHPEVFRAAVIERRFFETFREELIKGKELIIHRFPGLPEKVEVLAAALREGLEEERSRGGARPAEVLG